MNTQFTHEELRNIAALINAASIKGVEAHVIVALQTKIQGLLSTETPKTETPTE